MAKKSKKMRTINKILDWTFVISLFTIPIGLTTHLIGINFPLVQIAASWLMWSIITYFLLNAGDIKENHEKEKKKKRRKKK